MIALLLTAFALALAPSAAWAGDAVTLQLDPAHTGAAVEPGLDPPLQRVWTRRFGTAPTYPLIVGKRVFVAADNRDRTRTRLYALSATSGRTLWRRSLGGGGHGHPAYHDGRVFVLNDDSALFAFDAQSGELLWELPSEFGFNYGPPVGFDGSVYAVKHDMVRALDAETGTERWANVIEGSDASGPAVTDDRVFAAFSGQVYAFDRASGEEIWHPESSIRGGGGETPAFYRGRLYVRESGDDIEVYSGADGALLGQFSATDYVDPAYAFNTAYVLDGVRSEGVFEDGGTLTAVDLDNLRRRWRFRGDGWLQSSVLVVNRTVYVGSATGRLYAVDAQTGRKLWATHLSDGVSGEGFVSGHRALAAGRGLLVVPANRLLVAFR